MVQRVKNLKAIPPGSGRAIARPEYRPGNYGFNRSTWPPGYYDDREVFNQYGPEGFELTNGPLRKMTQFAFQAGLTAIQILPANDRRFYFILQNKSTTATMFFGYGSAIDANSGIGLAPGAVGPPQTPGGNTLNDYMCPTDAIWVFCATAAQLGVCAEGVLIS